MTELILVRHGVTKYNVDRRVQGSLETSLLKEGIGQAKDLGKKLAREPIDAAYCSNLYRAKQTAKEVLKYHKRLRLHCFSELNERSFGIAEGFSGRELQKYPGILSEADAILDHHYKPEKGESWNEVRHRAMKVIRKIVQQHANDTVFVAAHGGTNRMILSGLLGLPIQKSFVFRQHNACINRLSIRNKRVRVTVINDTCHIQQKHFVGKMHSRENK
ncbi:histidine phosphatase family protein [Candidatus Micrarchaeota archaeon]|nr:histidine phosphatase family protein [Candidatus Micrarchaeota archaeon]